MEQINETEDIIMSYLKSSDKECVDLSVELLKTFYEESKESLDNILKNTKLSEPEKVQRIKTMLKSSYLEQISNQSFKKYVETGAISIHD